MASYKSEKDNEVLEIARGLKGTPWCEEYEKMISGMLYAFTVFMSPANDLISPLAMTLCNPSC